jgi:mRNA interferase MazF
VTRGEIWFAEVGRRRRPVLIVTRPEVVDVRALVTVAEVTTSIRGLGSEVDFDHDEAGLDRPSVINCDGVYTVTKTAVTTYAGAVGDEVMERVCAAVGYALGY